MPLLMVSSLATILIDMLKQPGGSLEGTLRLPMEIPRLVSAFTKSLSTVTLLSTLGTLLCCRLDIEPMRSSCPIFPNADPVGGNTSSHTRSQLVLSLREQSSIVITFKVGLTLDVIAITIIPTTTTLVTDQLVTSIELSSLLQ